MSPLELKKKIVYDYNSLRMYAKKRKIAHSNLISVLNLKMRNLKIEKILIRDFKLPKNFFGKYFTDVDKLR